MHDIEEIVELELHAALVHEGERLADLGCRVPSLQVQSGRHLDLYRIIQ